jgi:hypothetical protein
VSAVAVRSSTSSSTTSHSRQPRFCRRGGYRSHDTEHWNAARATPPAVCPG